MNRKTQRAKPAQPSGLISVLLDPHAPLGDRDDAAMDLGRFPTAEVESALLKIARNTAEDENVLDSAGESLAEIWSSRQDAPVELIASLAPPAHRIAVATLKARRPDWADVLR